MGLMGLHRASIEKTVTDPIAKIMAWGPLTWMGGLAFPIFVVHGPLGQLFYKKVVATWLFGGPLNIVLGPWFFYAYLAIVLGSALVLQKLFLSNNTVKTMSSLAVDKFSRAL